MAIGPLPILSAIVLSPTEKNSGYATRPMDGGRDVVWCVESAVLDLQNAARIINMIIAALPDGANKTTLVAQLAALTATS